MHNRMFPFGLLFYATSPLSLLDILHSSLYNYFRLKKLINVLTSQVRKAGEPR